MVAMASLSSKVSLLSVAGSSVIVLIYLLSKRRRRLQLAQNHVWEELGLAVAPSLLQGAGQGLFVTRAFAQGETIALYYGEVLSFAKMCLCEERDYLMGGFGCMQHFDLD